MTQPSPQVFYEALFRTQRGGRGVEFETALAELRIVLRDVDFAERNLFPGRMRMWFDADPAHESALVALCPLLGYTEALTRITRLPGQGRGLMAERATRKRGLRGDFRIKDDLLRYEPLWQADEAQRREQSPHERPFLLELDGQLVRDCSRRQHRRMSVCDAKFLLNIAEVHPGDLLADPFAGIGGIVLQARSRGIDILCGDSDAILRPGLAEVSGNRSAVWNAAALPVRTGSLDAIVTEPPYQAHNREIVWGAIPELARCLKPGGRLCLLLSENLTANVMALAQGLALDMRACYTLRRQRMLSPALLFVKHQ